MSLIASKAVITDIQTSLKASDWQAVIDKCASSLELRTGDVRLHLFRGYAFDKLQQLPQAEAAYRAALKIENDNAQALQGLAQVQWQIGAWAHAADSFSAAASKKSSKAAIKLSLQASAAAFLAGQHQAASETLTMLCTLDDVSADATVLHDVHCRQAAVALHAVLAAAAAVVADCKGAAAASAPSGTQAAEVAGSGASSPSDVDPLYSASRWVCLREALACGDVDISSQWAHAVHCCLLALQDTASFEQSVSPEQGAPLQTYGEWASSLPLAAAVQDPAADSPPVPPSPMSEVGAVAGWPSPALSHASLRPVLVLLLATAAGALQVATPSAPEATHGHSQLHNAAETACRAWLQGSAAHAGASAVRSSSLAVSLLAASQPTLPSSPAALTAAATETALLFLSGTQSPTGREDVAAHQAFLAGALERFGWVATSPAALAARGVAFGVQGGVPAPRKGASAASDSYAQHKVSMVSFAAAVSAVFCEFVVVDPPSEEVSGGGGMARLVGRSSKEVTGLQRLASMSGRPWCVQPLLALVKGAYLSTLMGTDALVPVTGVLAVAYRSLASVHHSAALSALAGAWGGGGATTPLHPPVGGGARGATTLPANGHASHSLRRVLMQAICKLGQDTVSLLGVQGGSPAAQAVTAVWAELELLHSVTCATCGAEDTLGLTVTHLVPALPVSTAPAVVAQGAAMVVSDVVSSEDAAGMPLWGPLSQLAPPPAAGPNAILCQVLGPSWASQGPAAETAQPHAVSSAVLAVATRVLSAALQLALEVKGVQGGYMTPTAKSIFTAVCVHWNERVQPCLAACTPPLTPPAAAVCDLATAVCTTILSSPSNGALPQAVQRVSQAAAACTGITVATLQLLACMAQLCGPSVDLQTLNDVQSQLLQAAVAAPAWGTTYSVLAYVFRLKWEEQRQSALLTRAEQCAVKATQLNPSDVLARTLGCVLAAHRGEYALACTRAQAAASAPGLTDHSTSWASLLLGQLAQRGWSSATSSWSHSDLAHREASAEELKLAEGHFQRATAGRPYDHNVWLGLAQVYLGAGKISAAVKSGARALACWAGSVQPGRLPALQKFLELDTAPLAQARLRLGAEMRSHNAAASTALPCLAWEASVDVTGQALPLPNAEVFVVLAEAHLAQGSFEHAAVRAENALSVCVQRAQQQHDSAPIPAAVLSLCARAQLQCARQAAEDKRWPQVIRAVHWGRARAEQALGTADLPGAQVHADVSATSYKCLGDLLLCASNVCPAAFGSAALRKLVACDDACSEVQIGADLSVPGPHGMPLYLGPRAALLAPLTSLCCQSEEHKDWDVADAAVSAFAHAVEQATARRTATGDDDEACKLQLVEAWCDLGRCLFQQAQGVVAAGSVQAAGENPFLAAVQRGEGGSPSGLWAEPWAQAPELMQGSNAAFRAALEVDPSSVRAWNGAGLTEHNLLAAQHCLIQAASLGGGGIVLCNLGMVYLLAGQFVLARRAFSTAQHNDPSNQAMWVGVGHLSQVLAAVTSVADLPSSDAPPTAALQGAAAALRGALSALDASPAVAHGRAAAAFISATDLTSRTYATLPAGLAASNLAVGGDVDNANLEAPYATVGGGILSGTPPPISFLSMAVEEQPSSALALGGIATVHARRAAAELALGAQKEACLAAAAATRSAVFAVARMAVLASTQVPHARDLPTLLTALQGHKEHAGVMRCICKLVALAARCAVLLQASCCGLPSPPRAAQHARSALSSLAGDTPSPAMTLGALVGPLLPPGGGLAVSLLCCAAVERFLSGVSDISDDSDSGKAAASSALELLASLRGSLAGEGASLPELLLKARLEIVALGPDAATATLQHATRVCPDAHQPWRVALLLGHSSGQEGMVQALLPRISQVADTSAQRAARLAPHSATRAALQAASELSQLVAHLAQLPASAAVGDDSAGYAAAVKAVKRASNECERLQQEHPETEQALAGAELADTRPTSFLLRCSGAELQHLAQLWLAAGHAAVVARDKATDTAQQPHLAAVVHGCCQAALGAAAALGHQALAAGSASQGGHVAVSEGGEVGARVPPLAVGDSGCNSAAARQRLLQLSGSLQREAAALAATAPSTAV